MCPPTDTPSEPEFVKRAREIRERRDREVYKESSRGAREENFALLTITSQRLVGQRLYGRGEQSPLSNHTKRPG